MHERGQHPISFHAEAAKQARKARVSWTREDWVILATEDVKYWGDGKQSALPIHLRVKRLKTVLLERTADAIRKAIKRPEYLR